MEEERIIRGEMFGAIVDLTILIMHSRDRRRRRSQ
jgi:hypothetical protein